MSDGTVSACEPVRLADKTHNDLEFWFVSRAEDHHHGLRRSALWNQGVALAPTVILVARRIGETTIILTASPQFIKRHGTPTSIGELTELPCLVDTIPGHRHRWPIGQGVRVGGPVSANSGEIVRDLTLAGLGVSYLPDFIVAHDLKHGRLVRVLPDIEQPSIGIYAVFPPRRQIGSAARAFVDHLAARFV